jgi:hypothetical protein
MNFSVKPCYHPFFLHVKEILTTLLYTSSRCVVAKNLKPLRFYWFRSNLRAVIERSTHAFGLFKTPFIKPFTSKSTEQSV